MIIGDDDNDDDEDMNHHDDNDNDCLMDQSSLPYPSHLWVLIDQRILQHRARISCWTVSQEHLSRMQRLLMWCLDLLAFALTLWASFPLHIDDDDDDSRWWWWWWWWWLGWIDVIKMMIYAMLLYLLCPLQRWASSRPVYMQQLLWATLCQLVAWRSVACRDTGQLAS